MRTSNWYLSNAGACLLILGALPCPAWGDQASLVPSRDTTLIEVAPDRNNGGERWVNAGTTQNGTRNRGLFQWDFTGTIPAGATILSVELTLEVTRVPGCGQANSSFSLYRMLRPWGEGDQIALDNAGGQGAPATVGEATWLAPFFGGSPWSAPGGAAGLDYAAFPSGSQYIYDIGRSPYTFASEPELVADVQSWIDNPQSNFGWIFISDDEGTPFTARRFGSSEDPNVSPQLTVEFQIVPEPGAMALAALAIALAGGAAWRNRK